MKVPDCKYDEKKHSCSVTNGPKMMRVGEKSLTKRQILIHVRDFANIATVISDATRQRNAACLERGWYFSLYFREKKNDAALALVTDKFD